jgi:outer membrane protein assembly factor BamB
MVLAQAPAARGAAPAAAKPQVFPVSPASLAEHGMEVLWQTDLLLEPSAPLARLWLCGKYLVGDDRDHVLHAVKAATGVRLWSKRVAEPFQSVWRPAVDKDNLWVATTTRLIGIQGEDGRPIRVIDLDFAPTGRPVTNGIHLFVPDAKGWFEAVSLLDKVVPWGRWTDNSVTAGPVLDSNLVYFAGQNGVVYASAQNVRNVSWEYKTEGPVVADLQRTKAGLILVASLDYTLYAFQGASGRLAWRYSAGEPIRKTPYTAGNQVFVFTQGAGLTTLDASSGRPQWTLADGVNFLSCGPETVYVLTRAGALVALSRGDGKARFALPIRPGTIAAVDETDSGALYLALPDGHVMAAARKAEPEEKKPQAHAPAAPDAKKPDTPGAAAPAPDAKKPEPPAGPAAGTE